MVYKIKRKSSYLAKLSPFIVFILLISACSSNETSGNNEIEDENDSKAESSVTYEANVKDIVAENCLKCHGNESQLPMDSYENLLVYINGEETGSLMRRLDNGENTEDGQPGNMYEHLGETDEEREENLKILKEWVGYWTLKSGDELTDEEKKKFNLTEK